MNKAFRYLFKFFLFCVGFLLVYFCTAFICSNITVNDGISSTGPVTIYVKSNGVHTDLIVPLKTKQIDWTTVFPFKNTKVQDTNARFLALGWGDKGFYLNTPTWGDLTFKTAFKAMFGLSTSALHTTFLDSVETTKTCKEIKMNEKEYRLLVRYINRSITFNPKSKAIFIPTKAVYGDNDAFYEALGSYHMFSTCNTWTNSALKCSNKKACLWTPFDTGILNQYP
jgi:uncharacterized protein (TIGR02117 family)